MHFSEEQKSRGAKIPDIFDWTFTSEENLILQVVFDFEEP